MIHMYTVDTLFDLSKVTQSELVSMYFPSPQQTMQTETDVRHILECIDDIRTTGGRCSPLTYTAKNRGYYYTYNVITAQSSDQPNTPRGVRIVTTVKRTRGLVPDTERRCPAWFIQPDEHQIAAKAAQITLTHCYAMNYANNAFDHFNELMHELHGPQVAPTLDFFGNKVFSFMKSHQSDNWSRIERSRMFTYKNSTEPVITGMFMLHNGIKINAKVLSDNHAQMVAVSFMKTYPASVLSQPYQHKLV